MPLQLGLQADNRKKLVTGKSIHREGYLEVKAGIITFSFALFPRSKGKTLISSLTRVQNPGIKMI